MKQSFSKLFTVISLLLISIKMAAQTGVLDQTFGNGGIVLDTLSTNAGYQFIAQQTDGKIIVASNGTVFPYDFAVKRYKTDGTIDSSYGINGRALFSITQRQDQVRNIALQQDGKLLVACQIDSFPTYRSYRQGSILRLLSTGTLDSTFGNNGRVYYDTGINEIFVRPNGKIVVASVFGNVYQYDSSGSRESAVYAWNAQSDYFTLNACSSIQNDGKILVGGYSYITDSNQVTKSFFAVKRYNRDGSLDSSFGINGRAIGDTGVTLRIALQKDGKILLIGCTNIVNPWDGRVVRLNTDGSIDITFGLKGSLTFPSQTSSNINRVCNVVEQSDRKLVMLTWETNEAQLHR